MHEFNTGGMKKVPWQRESSTSTPMTLISRLKLPRSAIKRVAHHGMANRREMHPDLVGSACLNLYLKKREFPVLRINAAKHRVVRYRLSASFNADRHPRSPDRIASYGSKDGAAISRYEAVHERNVGLLRGTLSELRRELPVRLVVLGDNQQAARFFIQTMNNAWAQFTADARKISEAVEQRVDQRAPISRVVRCPRSRMHHHAGRLVDYDQIVIFIDNVERDIFCESPQRNRLRRPKHFDPLSTAEA
jgi:hypothetical protein